MGFFPAFYSSMLYNLSCLRKLDIKQPEIRDDLLSVIDEQVYDDEVILVVHYVKQSDKRISEGSDVGKKKLPIKSDEESFVVAGRIDLSNLLEHYYLLVQILPTFILYVS